MTQEMTMEKTTLRVCQLRLFVEVRIKIIAERWKPNEGLIDESCQRPLIGLIRNARGVQGLLRREVAEGAEDRDRRRASERAFSVAREPKIGKLGAAG